MRTKDFARFLQESQTITDFFQDNKCSSCGQCCGRFLPVSKADVKRIKNYVKDKDIRVIPERQHTVFQDVINYNCPFLDLSKKYKCQIYEARPTICRIWACREGERRDFPDSPKKYRIVDMYMVYESCKQ